MPAKLTRPIIQQRLDKIYNKSITYISGYKNAYIKCWFKCNHGHKFKTLLCSLLRYKNGCPQCYRNRKFDRKLNRKFHGKIKRLEDLSNSKIKFKCNHGHILKKTPENILDTGCTICKRIRGCMKEIKKSTHGKFHAENLYRDYHNKHSRIALICNRGHKITRIYSDVIRYGATCPKCHLIEREHKLKCVLKKENIKLESPYKNVKSKVKLKCLNCGYEWKATPDKLLRGEGCPICNNHDMNDYIFRKRLFKNSHGKIKMAKGYKYQGFKKISKFICNHHHFFKNTPRNILRNPSCPKCRKIRKIYIFKKRDKKFRRQLKKVHHGAIKEDKNYYYHGINKKTLLRCNKGHSWFATPEKVINSGEGCPYCNNSHGEIITQHELEKMNLKHCSYKRDLTRCNNAYKHSFRIRIHHHLLSIDFMVRINRKYYAIEFDGIQHFKPEDFSGKLTKEQTKQAFKKQQQHDKWKNEWCKEHYIRMIRIKNIHNYHNGRKMIKLVKNTLRKELPVIQESLF